jgi:hypothetical protein
MLDDNDQIPTAGRHHRNVPLHAGQSARRLAVVRADIDSAFSLLTVDELLAFARDVMRAPEARLLAGALLEARHAAATSNRDATPVDIDLVRASIAGLDSINWRDPDNYGTDLDARRGARRHELDEAAI